MKFITRLAVLFVAACGAAAAAQSALPEIGISEGVARSEVLRSVDSGSVNYSPAAKAFKAASGAARAQLATAGIAWARAYTESAAFQKAYAARRDNAKPRPPAFTGTPEEELANMRAQQAKKQEEAMKAVAAMPAEQRKVMEEAMRAAAETMKKMDTPEMRKMQLDGLRRPREAALARHQADLKKWEAGYPESAAALIARRLQAFLDVSADVDYDAALEARGGSMRFVNEAYERKDANWKLCYRAGRETVTAARAAAQAWLQDLQ